jgi:hypothetical protein
MPIHDWTRVPAGLFHDFHQSWSIRIKDALNAGRLPKGLSALVDQKAGPKEADVLAIERKTPPKPAAGSTATLDRPAARIVRRTAREIRVSRANRIVIKHHLGRIVAVIELVSPGNKDSRAAFRDFIDKTIDFLRAGVHMLVVDLFPPSPRDPFGVHKAIWDEIVEEEFAFPAGKDRIVASYESGAERVAYVEPVGVGDDLPEMALCIADGMYVRVPLEPTYRATWEASPEDFREAVETGVLPDPDAEE